MKKRRVIVLSFLLGSLYVYGIYALYSIISNSDYASVSVAQSQSSVLLETSRGTIYDCDLIPLTNIEEDILAVALPVPYELTEIEKYQEIDAQSFLEDAMPISYTVPYAEEMYYIDYFQIYNRYTSSSLATNLIGYVDYSGNGVSGIEKAFDDILSSYGGKLIMNYSVDALGRMIVGEDLSYENTLDEITGGVVLTLSSEIQAVAEEASMYLEQGAIVVVSVPDCEIKACVSVPSYSQVDLESAINDENSAMINRAFMSYSLGSVFKLIVTATALEEEYDENLIYECTGSIEVDGTKISCYGGLAHGEVNMCDALSKSCNCYYINLALELGEDAIWTMAEKMGLGTSIGFYENYSTSTGILTSLEDLSSQRALANFAIGQGNLLINPIQVAQIVNCIASNGVFTNANIYKGEILEDETLLEYSQSSDSIYLMETSVADEIIEYMIYAVEEGTAYTGAIENGVCGAKTGTAETGVYEDGEQLYNYWYAGFVGEDEPEYVIVVLNEGVKQGNNPTGNIFKEIGEYLLS